VRVASAPGTRPTRLQTGEALPETYTPPLLDRGEKRTTKTNATQRVQTLHLDRAGTPAQ
jgi:hypothetical protein